MCQQHLRRMLKFFNEIWAKAIEDLGEEKVLAMITDGAAVNKVVGALLE